MMILMGRPKKNRVKLSLMIDKRLADRVDAMVRAHGITRSEAVNRMMWLGVLGRPNLKEKEEFRKKIDILGEYCKSLLDNGL